MQGISKQERNNYHVIELVIKALYGGIFPWRERAMQSGKSFDSEVFERWGKDKMLNLDIVW